MQFCSMLHKLAFQEYLVLLYLVLCSLHKKKMPDVIFDDKKWRASSGKLLMNIWWNCKHWREWALYLWRLHQCIPKLTNFFLVFLLNKRSSSLFWFIVCKKVYSLLLKLEILYVQPDCYLKALSHSALSCTHGCWTLIVVWCYVYLHVQ